MHVQILYGLDRFGTGTVNINPQTKPFITAFNFLKPEPNHITRKPNQTLGLHWFGLDSRFEGYFAHP